MGVQKLKVKGFNMNQNPYQNKNGAAAGGATSGKATWSLILGIGSFCFSFVAGVPAIILGVMANREIAQSQGQIKGSGLATSGIVIGAIGSFLGAALFATFVLVALLLPATQAAREAARRTQSQNQLKQLGLGAHNFHEAYRGNVSLGTDSPSGNAGPNAGALVSWRTELLPFLESVHIYDQYQKEQPWDSPTNRALSTLDVPAFRNPNAGGLSSGQTLYLAIRKGPNVPNGLHTMFDVERRSQFSELTDGLSHTIMFVEADHNQAVPWSKTADLELDWNNPMRGIGGVRPHEFITVFGDGSMQRIPNTIDKEVLKNLMIRDDQNSNNSW